MAVMVDSTRNCAINVFLSVPSTLRMPTSFARLALRAVTKVHKINTGKQ